VRSLRESWPRWLALTALAGAAGCDAILICVPTPLGRHREPDLQYVRSTADEVARRMRPGQLVVLESTTYPGTTREELLPRIPSGLTPGVELRIVGVAPLGDPLELELRGYRLSVRKTEAARVAIESLEDR